MQNVTNSHSMNSKYGLLQAALIWFECLYHKTAVRLHICIITSTTFHRCVSHHVTSLLLLLQPLGELQICHVFHYTRGAKSPAVRSPGWVISIPMRAFVCVCVVGGAWSGVWGESWWSFIPCTCSRSMNDWNVVQSEMLMMSSALFKYVCCLCIDSFSSSYCQTSCGIPFEPMSTVWDSWHA
jgi:hypothetical protein